jgi:Dihydrodipicolinate synthetase family
MISEIGAHNHTPIKDSTMPLLDETATGVHVIAATPFGEDGTLDLASADHMVDFYLERGADGLTLLGIMGEAPKLSAEEPRMFLRCSLREWPAASPRSSASPRPASPRLKNSRRARWTWARRA